MWLEAGNGQNAGLGENDADTGYVLRNFTNTHAAKTTGISVKKVWNDENDVDGLRPASVTAELCYVNEAGETPQALKDSQVQKGPAAGPFVYAFRPVAKLWAFRNSPETWLGHTGT